MDDSYDILLYCQFTLLYCLTWHSHNRSATAAMDDKERNYIRADSYVMLVDNRGDKRLIRPADHRNFKWRKQPLKLAKLTEFQYYQTIEVGNDTLAAVESSSDEEVEEIGEDQNNKQIFTVQQCQKLKAQQIHELRNSKKADEIISTIVSHNEQFDKKTPYSKSKYLAKKKRKYLFRFHVQPTSLESVHQYYFEEEPKSVSWIRQDQLALLLLHASPFNRVLLAEQTKGLILAALLIQRAKAVTFCCEQAKNMKRFPVVEQLNIAKCISQERVEFSQWKQLSQSKKTFSNVVIVGNYNFREITEQIIGQMEPNCLICYYCLHLEPLKEALEYFNGRQQIIHCKLQDSWAREYQVLRNRTHPMMSMHSHSGYLVTAIKVGETPLIS